jgi:hypothetical protein
MIEVKQIGNKFHGFFNGNLIVKSSSKYYVERRIAEYKDAHVAPVKDEPSPVAEFSINKRFDFVNDIVKMVASRKIPSMIITGEGGLGKSYSVIKALRESGFVNITEMVAEGAAIPQDNSYVIIKGYSTPKGLFKTLYEFRNSVIVFDDTDSILKDQDALNILKGALDSYSKRIISWHTSSKDDSLPSMFNFSGGVIFISNLSPSKLDQALKTRSMCVDLTMTTDQKIERMRTILVSADFMPDMPFNVKEDSMNLIEEFKERAREVSLRTLINTIKIRSSNNNWRELAKYMLVS